MSVVLNNFLMCSPEPRGTFPQWTIPKTLSRKLGKCSLFLQTIHNPELHCCWYDATVHHVPLNRPPAERCLRDGLECMGFQLLWALKSLSRSSPRVTRWVNSCLAFFQMLMTSTAESLKLGHAIQPVVSGEALLMLETMVFLSPPRPLPSSLLCAAVIGTDVPLASHRAAFPLIATLYVDGLHLPQQLSQFPSPQPVFLTPFLWFSFHFSPDCC